jgi:hypothetical protein
LTALGAAYRLDVDSLHMTVASVSLPEAAQLLGVPHYVARRLAVSGDLGPTTHFAGRWVLDRAQVLSYKARLELGEQRNLATEVPVAG